MECASIQWSGGSIATLACCLVVFLIWASVMISSRRERKERAARDAAWPRIEHPLKVDRSYRLSLKSQPALIDVAFTGSSDGGAVQNMLIFKRPDGRRIIIKAGLIQIAEEL